MTWIPAVIAGLAAAGSTWFAFLTWKEWRETKR